MNLLADLAVLGLAASVAAPPGPHPLAARLLGLALLVPVWLLTAAALGHYRPAAWERACLDDLALVSVLLAAVTTVQAVATVALPSVLALPEVGRFALVAFPALVALRLAHRALRHTEAPLDEVLVVGAGPLGRATCEDLERRARRRVIGVLRFPDEPVDVAREPRLRGASDDLESLLREVPVAEVYLAGNATRQGAAMQRAVQVCERLGVPFALPTLPFRLERAQPVGDGRAGADGYVHFLCYAYRPAQMGAKRLFDIACSVLALWLLLPLFAVVMLAIRLTSRGPIFFKQVRVGLHGKPFHMLKFRSMVVDAEAQRARLAALNEMSGPVFKMKRDPRVTAVGRFIRKYSIDELPQLINVLRGDMSLVGPRPPLPSEVARYQAWQRRRLSVRPGLTCIWQVSGRNQISFEEWMYLDMRYIDHWSLSQDLQLIFRTVPVVLTGRGAS